MTYFHNEQDAIADWLTRNTPTICPPNTYAKPEWESDVSATIGNRLRGGLVNRIADAAERAKRERMGRNESQRDHNMAVAQAAANRMLTLLDMQAQGMSHAQIAAKIGTTKSNISRLFAKHKKGNTQ